VCILVVCIVGFVAPAVATYLGTYIATYVAAYAAPIAMVTMYRVLCLMPVPSRGGKVHNHQSQYHR